MGILNRVLLAVAISWVGSVTLGLLFAACASGHFSFNTLMLLGVIPVALISSTVVAIFMTPIAMWIVRTGVKNLCIYAPMLWFALAAYIVAGIPMTGNLGLGGLFLIAVAGSLILGLIPPSSEMWSYRKAEKL